VKLNVITLTPNILTLKLDAVTWQLQLFTFTSLFTHLILIIIIFYFYSNYFKCFV